MPAISIRDWSTEREAAIAHSLATAFPAIDDPVPDLTDFTDDPADSALRAVVPPPPAVPFEKLIAEAGQHRVLVFRGRLGIPLEVLLSVGGALLIHLIILGLFLTGFYFAVRSLPRIIGDGGLSADLGGAPAGLVINAGSPSPESMIGDSPLGMAGLPALPPAPSLPRLPEQFSTPAQIAQEQLAAQPITSPLGMREVTPDLGQVIVRPAPRPVAVGGTGAAAVGAIAAGGDPTATGDEPTFEVGRGGGGGASGGRGGEGRGIGPGYGPSGANFPEPQILDTPMPANPRISKKPITLEVQVLASGQIGTIRIVESCGEAEVDEFYRKVVASWKYSPAIIAGKPVTKTKEITLRPYVE